ncbi:pentapeptide repeat-containing protein [Leptolyngbya sp. BC1307]|uniref:WD40 repeat domain-containing protein n=1 Tax=Leptolyngbya sp. BC1307 TaxID=2029589 RepID=UPI000EFCB063|nr:pentapeptide repeat-containing protein [Leptolyngbya sp. BC1307]
MNHLTLLKSGIERWNQRRASQLDESYNLAGQNLRDGYFFEGDFSGISLRGADLQRACLIGANFRGADLSEANLSGAYLSDADFTQANLSRANLTGANIERVDLCQANLFHARVANANIDEDQLSRLDLDAAGVVQNRLAHWSAAAQFVAQSPGEAAALASVPAARFSRQIHPDYRAEAGGSSPQVATIYRDSSLETQPESQPNNQVLAGESTSKSTPLQKGMLWGSAIALGLIALTVGLPLALNSAPEDLPVTNRLIAQPVANPAVKPGDAQPIVPLTVAQSIEGASQVWAVAATQIDDAVNIFGGDANGQITVWDGQGDILQTLDGHTDTVRGLAVSGSGDRLVSSSGDAIKVWRPATGELVYSIPVERAPVWAVAISPDEQTLISSDYDGIISTWQLGSGEPIYSIDAGSTVWSVAIAPDGQSFVSGSSDQTIRQWDLSSGELLQTFTGHSDAVRSVAIDPEGKTLASASWDGTAKLWNLATGELQATLDGHNDRVVALAISPDGKTLVSGSIDNTIKYWDLSNCELIETLSDHTDWILSLAFTPLDPTLISGSKDDTVKVWQ